MKKKTNIESMDATQTKALKSAMQEIKRGMCELIGEEYLEELVARFIRSGERFIIKVGFDPTAPDLHLGHSVLLNKIATLQRYGGAVKFLIGDFTATIGDPSGKSETRKVLSFEVVKENAKTYQKQVFKILNEANTEICFNSTWLRNLGAEGLITLTSKFSVARLLERDDFAKRYKNNQSISVVEFLYPLLQGYDSVALGADIELGGNDQKFNLLMGRSLQRAYGMDKEQSVMMMPLLEGLDGVNKMSKSSNNYISLQDDPNDMYAKILSISDELMWRYYELLSTKSIQEIEELKNIHPKQAKEILALEICTRYHDETKAREAKDEFDKVFSQEEIPSDIKTFAFNRGEWICHITQTAGLVPSTSQARREIKAGALKLNREKIQDENLKLESGEYILQLGKRRFAKIVIS